MFKFYLSPNKWIVLDFKLFEKRNEEYFIEESQVIKLNIFDCNLKNNRKPKDSLELESIIKTIMKECLLYKTTVFNCTIAFTNACYYEILHYFIIGLVKKGIPLRFLPFVCEHEQNIFILNQHRQVLFDNSKIEENEKTKLFSKTYAQMLEIIKETV
ncbi:hypothetical protein EHP00_7 [Ecytonucleospora hepatopenaei]|uniref:Uncharacterized protein n=1 Tax=Ecytonucleospora hepatopenaei TaxID=646526 RepID=A0A1W0E5P0_9MICR|nr:hypothetical protein EHP00_7 [Ecytonucleospora hepatopenaei]